MAACIHILNISKTTLAYNEQHIHIKKNDTITKDAP